MDVDVSQSVEFCPIPQAFCGVFALCICALRSVGLRRRTAAPLIAAMSR
jgi:hypothetical protein